MTLLGERKKLVYFGSLNWQFVKQTWHSVLFKWYKWNKSFNRRCNIWLSVCRVKVYCNKWHFGKNVSDLIQYFMSFLRLPRSLRKLDSKCEMWILVLNMWRDLKGMSVTCFPSHPALDVGVAGSTVGCEQAVVEMWMKSLLELGSISHLFWFWELSLLM